MAKNNYKMNVNQYSNQAEQIRKAKGQPQQERSRQEEKTATTAAILLSSYMAQKIVDKANQQERVKLPTWLNVTLGVEFAAVLIVLILRMTAFKDSAMLGHLSSVLLGVTCGTLFYIRKYKHTKKNSGLYTVITIVLVIMCLLYTTFGVLGLLGFLG